MKGSPMSDEITELKTETIKLNTKISKQETEIDRYKLKLETARSKLAEYKATHKIKILESKEKISEKIDLAPILKKAEERMRNVGTGEDNNP